MFSEKPFKKQFPWKTVNCCIQKTFAISRSSHSYSLLEHKKINSTYWPCRKSEVSKTRNSHSSQVLNRERVQVPTKSSLWMFLRRRKESATFRPSSKDHGISAMLHLDPGGTHKLKPTEAQKVLSIPVNVQCTILT